MDLSTLCVQEGKHDFTPNIHPFFISKRRNRMKFRIQLLPSMWYDVNAPEHPKDKNGKPYKGWNKLGGFSQGYYFFGWPNNTKRSVMIGEFPGEEEGSHKLVLYINDKYGKWHARELMTCWVGRFYEGYLDWNRHSAKLFIIDIHRPDEQAEATIDIKRSNWLPLRGIGAWHGGQFAATADRCFRMEVDYV